MHEILLEVEREELNQLQLNQQFSNFFDEELETISKINLIRKHNEE